MSLGAVDEKQKVSPVDIDDTKHVKMDEIIHILDVNCRQQRKMRNFLHYLFPSV